MKGRGHNQSKSNFGLCFIFVQICLILACGLQMDRKTFLCIFSRWFSVRFREITYAKNVRETKVFFCRNKRFLLFLPKQKNSKEIKAASKLNVFCTLLLENEEKTSVKKYGEMFSYQ